MITLPLPILDFLYRLDAHLKVYPKEIYPLELRQEMIVYIQQLEDIYRHMNTLSEEIKQDLLIRILQREETT